MTKRKQPKAAPSDPGFVPVCAIGASAGGVGALQTLFRLLPDDLGLAYVVVVHLSPDHPSAMHEIIGGCTKMPVHQVNDGPTLKENCVYVIAPDSELVIEGDNVKARPFTDPRSRRAPIDMFFRSIASSRGDGIAVVLTGAGSDGALGVRAIKEAGGIVMVQEPAEAGFPSMPQNAIATGVADVVAPLARLAERIAEAAHSKEAVRSLDEDGAANDVRRIVAFLRTRTGHDFSGYKRSTVLRRIQRRMQVCSITSLSDYAQYLRGNPEEAKELLSDLLISVTMFFRDPETFISLDQRVIQPLLESRSSGDTEGELRAWVVGCATGEEAYSLAILFLEAAERLKITIPIQIFATDLDEGALATAREGRYPRTIEADISAKRLKRFFVDEGTHYRIDPNVRDLVLFAAHSVVRDPPFMRLDLIACRNVLIYLEKALQNHVNSIFRYGLRPDGYLFLGTAETADASNNLFAVVDREARIYRALPARPDFVPVLAAPMPVGIGRPALTENRLTVARFDAGEVLGESHAAALETSAPPSALVDADGVLHLSPTAGRFILLSAGPLSGRLPSIVRPELRLDLKLALDRAFDAHQPTITRPIDVAMEGDVRRVSMHVAPLPVDEGASPRAIVYFLDSGPGGRSSSAKNSSRPDELKHLHSELKAAQEAELASRIRNEAAVQELRASNEELQSLNEEYRSTAEELETSKEELQSINEELQTVNAELKSKLGIISSAHNDLQNLTASSEIGTLFLDRDLRIRMFTPPVADLINLADADVGRPITDFTHRLEYEDIAADVRRVLRDPTPFEAELQTTEGRWFLVRIRPYRTIEGTVDGAVATFDDITERKRTSDDLAEEFRSTEILRELSAQLVSPDNIQAAYEDILTAAIKITRAKAGTVQMFDAEANELVVLATRGFSAKTEKHFHRLDASSSTSCGLALRTGKRSYANFEPRSSNASARMHVSDGVLSAQSSPLLSRSGKPMGMVSTHWGEPDHRPTDRELRFLDLLVRQASDLIEQRQADAALRESEERYRALFESMDEAYAIVEVLKDASGEWCDFRFIEVNPAFILHTSMPWPVGKTGTELLGTPNPRWAALYGQALDTDTPIRAEEEEATLGRTFDVNIFALDRNRNRVAILFTNVTARKMAEAALRDSEERLRDVLDSIAEGFANLGPDFTILDVNEATLRLDGRTRSDLVGRSHWDAFPGTANSEVGDLYRQVMRTREPASLEHRYLWPNGRDRWLDVHVYPTADGGIATFWRDITDSKAAADALQASERWQQTLVEGVPQLVWRAVDAGHWTWASPQWTSYTGQAEPDSHDLGWLAVVHPDDRDGARERWHSAIDQGEFRTDCRLYHAAEDRFRWFQTRATPVRSENGEIVEWLGTSTDIDDLRQLQERQGVLVAELQHRTRNLITVVGAMSKQTLRNATTLEEFRDRFADRLSALSRVQGMLSQLTVGQRVTFDELLRSELAALNTADDKVTLSGPADVELRSADLQTFALALHELATNALKYGALASDDGRLTVQWEMITDDDGISRLRVDWRETGVDVPQVAEEQRGGGYGRELIEQALPYQLDAKTSYEITPEGVHCVIDVPTS